MNQSEIDAGPPNKKPKIGTNTNVIITGPGVNGLSTQMSETGLLTPFPSPNHKNY